MKRRELIRHLEANGCLLLREGGNHTIYYNPLNRKTSTVPRHTEIVNVMAKKICKNLDIPSPISYYIRPTAIFPFSHLRCKLIYNAIAS